MEKKLSKFIAGVSKMLEKWRKAPYKKQYI